MEDQNDHNNPGYEFVTDHRVKPANGRNIPSVRVFDTIKILAEDSLAMVIVTHQIGFIKNLAHRIIFIDDSKISCLGTPEYILNNNSNARLQDFLIRLRENI